MVARVVDFDDGTDSLYQLDLTIGNKELDAETIADMQKFAQWVENKLHVSGCRYGIGGYMENRTIYAFSALFNNGDTVRRHHLGMDIWGTAGTPVYSPLCGKVHSFNDNNNPGDYGPTVILEHNLDGLMLYTLYGHLSRKNLNVLHIGMRVERGQQIGVFGDMNENGQWPPHLHFQLMFDMEGKRGDYPGVCSLEEKERYRQNTPDPQLLLRFPAAINA